MALKGLQRPLVMVSLTGSGSNVGLAPPSDSVSRREWVAKSGMLIAMSVYTFLRLIVDHGAPNLLPLRQKEVDYCISMLREKVSGVCGR